MEKLTFWVEPKNQFKCMEKNLSQQIS
jgi:hypothetical protein